MQACYIYIYNSLNRLAYYNNKNCKIFRNKLKITVFSIFEPYPQAENMK